MEWIIKIFNKPKQRILVKFIPQKEQIIFTGQVRLSNNNFVRFDSKTNLWVDFSEEIHPMRIDLETIQELLYKVYEKMNERIKIHEDLSKSFIVINTIEINE